MFKNPKCFSCQLNTKKAIKSVSLPLFVVFKLEKKIEGSSQIDYFTVINDKNTCQMTVFLKTECY